MHIRSVAIAVVTAAATGLLALGAGHADAAKVISRGDTTYFVFTNDETMKISAAGVASILDQPDVRNHWSAGPDKKTHEPIFVIPGKGVVVRTTAERLVREAAEHEGGQLIVGVHPSESTVITLYTKW